MANHECSHTAALDFANEEIALLRKCKEDMETLVADAASEIVLLRARIVELESERINLVTWLDNEHTSYHMQTRYRPGCVMCKRINALKRGEGE